MSAKDQVTIHTDGASRGNPGPAAYGFVIEQPGNETIEENGCLDKTTNNFAEYTAVVKALEKAKDIGAQKVALFSDSELLVKQLNGEYKVKSPDLRPLFNQIQKLKKEFESVRFTHVRREKNKRADELCNEALDYGPRPAPLNKAAPKPSAPPSKTFKLKRADVHQDAIECLRAVADAWAKGDPKEPKPEDVWDQLWNILEEGGVLR